MRLRSYIHTAILLGPISIFRALRYRAGLRLGLNPVKRLKESPVRGPFFSAPQTKRETPPPPSRWRDSALAFGHIPIAVSEQAPDWHTSVLTGARVPEPDRDWWRIPDFDPSVGDIKGVWELSRFDWVLAYAQQAAAGDGGALARLNHWLDNWCQANPPYLGPNWKCGQESSIRVMHLAMATLILQQGSGESPQLRRLIRQHLQRIAPTITYAVAQDNNHGTSEAAALFIGGSWLRLRGDDRAKHWERLGRKWLENRALRLIEDDGSFSQYSVNYHRVMLDTYNMAEIWRRRNHLDCFSDRLYDKLRSATKWLCHMANAHNGDTPNIGANDGARLLPLGTEDYRDFRPSIYVAAGLFLQKKIFAPDLQTNDAFSWLGLSIAPDQAPLEQLQSTIFDDGGYAVLYRGRAKAVIRFPKFRFRPSHADCLHLDLWLDGTNLLRDGGTYSYNTESKWLKYFPGTASHNTIQFDDRDQMPRLSRFLFADWIRTTQRTSISTDQDCLAFSVAYRDGRGVTHQRSFYLDQGSLRVKDVIQGFSKKASLRWRLDPNTIWHETRDGVTNGEHSIHITCSAPIRQKLLTEGWESRYYYKKNNLPVLEIIVDEECELTSTYRWSSQKN